MSRKSRFSLIATLLIVSLTLSAPFNSLTLLASAFTRTAAAINKAPLALTTTPDAATKALIAENFSRLPMSSEANEGQFSEYSTACKAVASLSRTESPLLLSKLPRFNHQRFGCG